MSPSRKLSILRDISKLVLISTQNSSLKKLPQLQFSAGFAVPELDAKQPETLFIVLTSFDIKLINRRSAILCMMAEKTCLSAWRRETLLVHVRIRIILINGISRA